MNFQEEVLKNQSHLNFYALSLTVDEQAAKDLTQETLLKALRNEDRYVDKKNLRSWLFTIMKNTFINQYRRENYRRKALVDVQEVRTYSNSQVGADTGVEMYVLRQDLYDSMKSLDVKYRIPFVLFYKGYKYKEIAERLDLPLGTVKSRIYFARKLLMEDLKHLV